MMALDLGERGGAQLQPTIIRAANGRDGERDHHAGDHSTKAASQLIDSVKLGCGGSCNRGGAQKQMEMRSHDDQVCWTKHHATETLSSRSLITSEVRYQRLLCLFWLTWRYLFV